MFLHGHLDSAFTLLNCERKVEDLFGEARSYFYSPDEIESSMELVALGQMYMLVGMVQIYSNVQYNANLKAYLEGEVNSVIEGASKAGQGFDTFNDLKKAIGSPGKDNQWHHIVEQSQINKSGFSANQIQNTNNIIAVDKAIHAKISGYYNTKSFDFTGGKSVRDWLAGQSYEAQYEFGMNVLKMFGVTK